MYHRESQIADTPNRIGLASYVYSLDNQTTSNYLAFATSYFGSHSLISSMQVAQSILGASSFRLSFFSGLLTFAYVSRLREAYNC